MSFAASHVLQVVFADVAYRVRDFGKRIEADLRGDTVEFADPGGAIRIHLGFADDGRGAVKLYASAMVDRGQSRSVGANLGRLLGMVQVLPRDDGAEVRRWSPYRIEDAERRPAEAVEWAAAAVETIAAELWSRARMAAASVNAAATVVPVVGRTTLAPDVLVAHAEAKADPSAADALRARIAELESDLAASAASVVAAKSEAGAFKQQLDAVTLERNALIEQLTFTGSPAAVAIEPPPDPAPILVSAFGALIDAGMRPSTCVAVLRSFLEIAPHDAQLREELGIHLLRDDQLNEAVKVLTDLGADGLTPRGAGALVEASFRRRKLPGDIAVLERVDWRSGGVLAQLRDLPSWAPKDLLVEVATIIARGSPPPDFDSFLTSIAKVLPDGQLRQLFELMNSPANDAALAQLIDWAQAQRVGLRQDWVRGAIRDGLLADDRRVIRSSLDLLVEDASAQKDGGQLLGLVKDGGELLRAADWRSWAIPWIREGVAIGGTQERIDGFGELALAVLRESSPLRDGDPELDLITVLEPRVSPDVARQLQDERDRLRPQVDMTVRDVTTVSEALKAAQERHVGLVVLPEATSSAAKRGTVGVAKARESLFALGEIADRYLKGELDEGLDEALATLPGYKPDVSPTAKQQYRQDYLRTLPDKTKIMLGPHIDIGGGDAGRAYFQVDRSGKRIWLGYLGHLRGKRDT